MLLNMPQPTWAVPLAFLPHSLTHLLTDPVQWGWERVATVGRRKTIGEYETALAFVHSRHPTRDKWECNKGKRAGNYPKRNPSLGHNPTVPPRQQTLAWLQAIHLERMHLYQKGLLEDFQRNHSRFETTKNDCTRNYRSQNIFLKASIKYLYDFRISSTFFSKVYLEHFHLKWKPPKTKSELKVRTPNLSLVLSFCYRLCWFSMAPLTHISNHFMTIRKSRSKARQILKWSSREGRVGCKARRTMKGSDVF